MTFISYAQNFEDVMLWRTLKHIECGFYIDVGANDPSIESVTKAFYERGWNGINIEPISTHFTDLQRERSRDINLRCAVGASKGEIEIWECDVRGWASVDKLAIEKHTAMGKIGKYHQVSMVTLAEICEQYALHEIHFLKIDVEGFERSVLEGMDFGRFRPWIVVVEATRPNSTEEVYFQWEELLVETNYVFVYADGLNRYYLAREHEELAEAFKYPPNVFDDFVKVEWVEAKMEIQQAEAKAQQAEAKAQQAEAKAQQAEAKAQQAEAKAQQSEAKTQQSEAKAQQAEAKAQQAEAKAQQSEAKAQQSEAKAQQSEAKAQQAETALIAVHNSSSWRLTTPLRMVGCIAKSTFHLAKATKSKNKERVKLLMAHAKLYINQRPKLRRAAFAVLERLPALEGRMRRATIEASEEIAQHHVAAIELANLSPRARRIYDDLKVALENHSKENS
jgi:FkbM family methyltransferase